jgi:hypothetical protein
MLPCNSCFVSCSFSFLCISLKIATSEDTVFHNYDLTLLNLENNGICNYRKINLMLLLYCRSHYYIS